MEGVAAHSLVTFLWRAGEETTHVVVAAGALFARYENRDRTMRRLEGTDLFYFTHRFRNDLRTWYNFVPNLPFHLVRWWDLSDEARRQFLAFVDDLEHWKADPFNSHQLLTPMNYLHLTGPTVVRSLLELPGAPLQPWVARREGVARGEVHKHTFRSAILGNERQVRVYTPPRYAESGAPYGLLLVFDGAFYLPRATSAGGIPTDRILDNLLAEGRIPPTVAVFIGNVDWDARMLELPCYEPFADFLATELVPWVRRNYQVSRDPAQTVVAGSSVGGLAASFAAFRHPELFGNVLSQSAFYGWGPGLDFRKDPRHQDIEREWLTKQYAASPKLPLRFYLEAGLHEVLVWPPGTLQANRCLRDALLSKGYRVHYAEFNGGHDALCWRGTFADGLIALIAT